MKADVASSLSESEISLLRDAFEDAPFEFWARDLDGTCVVANATTRRLGDILGRKVESSPVPRDVLAAWQANNRRAYAGELVQNELQYDDGEHRRHLQCYVVPLRIRGEVKGILGFNIDVTERERTEEALRVSERRLNDALNVGRMGWLDWDLVTNEMHWSPETYRLFGHEPGGPFSPTIEGTVSMVPPEDLAFVQERLDAAIQGTTPYDVIHRMIRGDGQTIHVHAKSQVMRDEQGKPLRMLGTVVDVSDRVHAERELREVDRRRDEFLGVLSHELRNPLAVIASSVRCLEHGAIADEQDRRAIVAIERQTRHLRRLVDDLLDVTRIRSGKISLQRDRVDLARLVRETVDDHRELLAGRTVEVAVPAQPAWTHGDPSRLAQVIGNLLNNAAKFTLPGGSISVSLTTCGDRLLLEVADTGIGIDRESLPRLFVPFVQAEHRSKHGRAGLGLGLALVKTLVELHGGEVRADSEGPGRGARFSIALPLDASAPSARAPAPRRVATPRTILIVEDDADVAEWLALALSFSGHHVTVSLDAAEGLAMARALAPDVILCDIGLAGPLDGYGVARALQGDPQLATIHRIALSGHALPRDQRQAREAGFEAHLSKPPDLDALERLLAALPARTDPR